MSLIFTQGEILPVQNLVSSSTLATTTSATDVLVAGMTATPEAGTYLVWFSGDLTNTSNNSAVIVSIYAGGVQAANSERQKNVASKDVRTPCGTIARVVVNGAQAIEARWRTGGSGTAEARGRGLMIFKVA